MGGVAVRTPGLGHRLDVANPPAGESLHGAGHLLEDAKTRVPAHVGGRSSTLIGAASLTWIGCAACSELSFDSHRAQGFAQWWGLRVRPTRARAVEFVRQQQDRLQN